jgi:hypothetical protein
MNKTSALTALAIAALVVAAQAVPSGINYQGVLTDSQGQPFTGTRAMSIKLYDAATSGTLLYTEDLGTVSVTDGVFSFEFGTSGTSNAEQSDTVATTDGSASSFQKVLSASPVVAGTVSVSDGTYTWSQSAGSSNEDDFSVVYSTNLRRVSVTYLNGAPAAGRTITTFYLCPSSGISGALAGDNQPWAEITVDGVAQVPRQKVLTVPFAAVAGEATRLSTPSVRTTLNITRFAARGSYDEASGFGQPNASFPIGNGGNPRAVGSYLVPESIRRIHSVTLTFNNPGQYNDPGQVFISVGGRIFTDATYTDTGSNQTKTLLIGQDIPFGETWTVYFACERRPSISGNASIVAISLDVDVQSAALP